MSTSTAQIKRRVAVLEATRGTALERRRTQLLSQLIAWLKTNRTHEQVWAYLQCQMREIDAFTAGAPAKLIEALAAADTKLVNAGKLDSLDTILSIDRAFIPDLSDDELRQIANAGESAGESDDEGAGGSAGEHFANLSVYDAQQEKKDHAN